MVVITDRDGCYHGPGQARHLTIDGVGTHLTAVSYMVGAALVAVRVAA